jgi:hypothetical protein
MEITRCWLAGDGDDGGILRVEYMEEGNGVRFIILFICISHSLYPYTLHLSRLRHR